MKCFVIMPFSETRHKDKNSNEIITVKDEWTHIFNNWIKKAVESYPDKKINCIRSGATPGNFIKGIVQDINSCELVIADLTGQRPNVYYELGIRHALRLGTITISQDLKAVPSDLQSYYCFEYTYETAGYKQNVAYKAFEAELHEKIKHILENPKAADNPVADFVKIEQYVWEEQKKLNQKKFISLFNTLYKCILEAIEELENLITNEETFVSLKVFPPNGINSNIFTSLYTSYTTSNFHETLTRKQYDEFEDLFRIYANSFYYISQQWSYASLNPTEYNIREALVFMKHLATKYKETSISFSKTFSVILSDFENDSISFDDLLKH